MLSAVLQDRLGRWSRGWAGIVPRVPFFTLVPEMFLPREFPFFFVRINLDEMGNGGSRLGPLAIGPEKALTGNPEKHAERFMIARYYCRYRRDISEKVLSAISKFMISQSE